MMYTFAEFEAQATYVARIVSGAVRLPTPEEVRAEREDAWNRAGIVDPRENMDDEEWEALPPAAKVGEKYEEDRIGFAHQMNRLESYIATANLGPAKSAEWSEVLSRFRLFFTADATYSYSFGAGLECPCEGSTFRDAEGSFRNIQQAGVWGNTAPLPHHTAYRDALDDSAACFFDATQCEAAKIEI